ncbi:hypothetical protein GIB67_010350 [Kingdonia uniflora]|uniref:Pentatricopeptide repeat-containing protein n=1 Tax=Kingdonia uniflora TaxID=39325 RepID=A0A7J7MA57_9MAGN|nr:hypothetical protein GIB67_010350 [Kingdonia uniflora]
MSLFYGWLQEDADAARKSMFKVWKWDMHFSGLLLDNYTFPSVVRSCAVLSALREGKETHCNVIKNGLGHDMFVRNSLVTMYAQSGDILSSELAFEGIVDKNIISWTTMVAGYVQNELYKEGFSIFWRMVSSGTQPNAVTLVSILPACASLDFLDFGKLIHGYGVKVGLDSDIPLVNTLIALYGKSKDAKRARSLFDQMDTRDLVSWNSMIAAYEHSGFSKKAIRLFRVMQDKKIEYNYITMVSVISACTSLGAFNMGEWVHELVIRKGLQANVSVTNALIDMYAKLIGAYGNHEHGKVVFEVKEGVRPNMFTFTAALTACRHSGLLEEDAGRWEDVETLKKLMNEKELKKIPCHSLVEIDKITMWSWRTLLLRYSGSMGCSKDPQEYAIMVIIANMRGISGGGGGDDDIKGDLCPIYDQAFHGIVDCHGYIVSARSQIASDSSFEEEYIGFTACYDSSSNSEANWTEEEESEYGWTEEEEEEEIYEEEEETDEEDEEGTDEEEEKETDEEEEEEEIEENGTKEKDEDFVCACGYCFIF